MEFIPIGKSETKKNSVKKNSVRRTFYKLKAHKSFMLTIRLGEYVCEKINFRNGDKIILSYCKENNKIFKLEKSITGGSTLSSRHKYYLLFQATWNLENPKIDDLKIKDVLVHTLGDGYIILDFS